MTRLDQLDCPTNQGYNSAMPVKTTSSKQTRPLKRRRQTKPRAPKRSSGAPALSAQGYVRAIKRALAEGAYLRARRMSSEGAAKFPKDEQLAHYALVLGLPRVHGATHAPDPTISADQAWLKENGARYRGKWVALRSGTLAGAADSLRALLDAVGQDRDTYYTKLF